MTKKMQASVPSRFLPRIVRCCLKTKLKVLQGDDKSRIMIGDFVNITANRMFESIRKKQELHDAVEASHKDSSTGVYNKFFTESIIRKKLTVEADGICMLLILDVDMLNQINDNYGHPVGDQVIVAVAGVMREQFRDDYVIGRIGGDEFMGLVCGLKNEAMARNIVERLLGAVSKIKICDFGISVSIGCVLTEPGREDFDVCFTREIRLCDHPVAIARGTNSKSVSKIYNVALSEHRLQIER